MLIPRLHRRHLLLGGLTSVTAALVSGRPPAAAVGIPAATIVYDGAQLKAALRAASPGDTITLAPGAYDGGGELVAAVPNLTLRALVPLGPVLRSRLRARAEGIRIDGLAFDGATLEVAANGVVVSRCRLAHSPEAAIMLTSGRGVRVSRCEIVSFRQHGIVVRRATSAPLIERNHIHDAVKGGATNGHEAIQVGRSMRDTDVRIGAVIEYNLLERVDAEGEAVSIKSSGNTFRFNTLRDSRSFVCNRHGHDNVYAGNTLCRSYGLVVMDRGARILGNRCASPLNKRGARIMGGDVHWDSKLQGHFPQAFETYLCGNQFVDASLTIGDMWRGLSLPAVGTTVAKHSGRIKVMTATGTNLNGVPVEVPQAVELAAADVGPGSSDPRGPSPAEPGGDRTRPG